ncbi:MAG: hypothetical protein UX65_C0005G0016 [Parcubacteria group bacterium GW2011_GWB1_46_8]|nr:MAG: hypothetical protein UX14_C0028G0007 [Parcubacteria group bacterium GW2011_GWF1_45_5]KKU11286.1 MAG: hypothetical protein UX15_C0011G0010 [Parcubacteria group bacterium GW2011_GWA1_45_7]KKU46310.1 MAG: hypothetical protein UX65_C0005G0016 [Parcubacteria group bacterium GW2011_GWB1_46_8]
MLFFKKLVKSVYSPALYQEIIQQPPKQAVKYYIGMIALISLVAALIFTFVATPLVKEFLNELNGQIMSRFPQELKLVIKEGKVSINMPEPYMVRLPDEYIKEQRDSGSSAPFENAIIVDTKTEFSYERFSAYNTFAWITNEGIAVADQEVRARYVPFGTPTNQIIDKPLVESLLQKILLIASRALYFLIPVVFLLVFILYLFNMAYCALLAFLVQVIANKVNHLSLSYKQAWAATLYLATLGTVWTVIDICIPGFAIPLGFTIITLVLAYANLGKIQASNINTTVQSSTPSSIPPTV